MKRYRHVFVFAALVSIQFSTCSVATAEPPEAGCFSWFRNLFRFRNRGNAPAAQNPQDNAEIALSGNGNSNANSNGQPVLPSVPDSSQHDPDSFAQAAGDQPGTSSVVVERLEPSNRGSARVASGGQLSSRSNPDPDQDPGSIDRANSGVSPSQPPGVASQYDRAVFVSNPYEMAFNFDGGVSASVSRQDKVRALMNAMGNEYQRVTAELTPGNQLILKAMNRKNQLSDEENSALDALFESLVQDKFNKPNDRMNNSAEKQAETNKKKPSGGNNEKDGSSGDPDAVDE